MWKAEKIFKEMTEYWNITLPIKKLDLVALPYYTGVKPSDSWGLVAFK
jgi:aminopeptidase N